MQKVEGHKGEIQSLAFSADGRRLVSTSRDTSALVWDLNTKSNPGVSALQILRNGELEDLWADLADKDAAKADRAAWRLVRTSEQSITFLRNRLHAAKLDLERLKQLVNDLDAKRFAVRDKAQTDLAELGEDAELALQNALKNEPSLEKMKRIESLLERLTKTTVSPDHLRQLRSIEVLEHIGSAPVREILEELALGSSDAQLTKEANESLKRLNKSK